MRKVRVVIVNYRSAYWVRRCVSSLDDAQVAAVTIRNNDPSSQERAALAELASIDSRVTVLPGTGNIGFGAAVNEAVAAVPEEDDDIVWVLNPDVEVRPGAVPALVAAIDRFPDMVVSPVVMTGSDDGTEEVWYAGGDFVRDEGRTPHRTTPPPAGTIDRTSTFMTGAAMMLSRRTWERVGGYREDLFLYWEDAEISMRMLYAGIRMGVVADATIFHGVNKSTASEGSRATYFYYMQRNRLRVCSDFTTRRALILGAGRPMTLRLLRWPLANRTYRWGDFAASLRGLIAGALARQNPRIVTRPLATRGTT